MESNPASTYPRQNEDIFCQYGYEQLFRHLSAFTGEMHGAKKASDIEHIHQLRVYSRRISTTLRLFNTCFPNKSAKTWRKQIRKTARSFGEVRDLDVQIEFIRQYEKEMMESDFLPGIQRLELRLVQRRDKLQKQTVSRLKDLEKSGILQEIRSFLSAKGEIQPDNINFSQSLYQLACDAIQTNLYDMMKFDDFVLMPDKVDELHQMRIAAKGLRYTIEVFTFIYPDKLKKHLQVVRLTQEMLGNIHDLDVWKIFIPEFISQETGRTIIYFGTAEPIQLLLPGLNQFEMDVITNRDQTYKDFCQKWIKWKKAKVWEDLLKKIRLPMNSNTP